MNGSPNTAAEPVVLVIHGVGRRLESEFRSQVSDLAARLGIAALFVPIYWGDLLRPDERVDAILPYQRWADDQASAEVGWAPGPHDGRHRVLGAMYGFVHDAYVRASSQFTGDLVYYQRHQNELWQRVWHVLDAEVPGAGGDDRPISVVAHSLGSAIAFDMAVAGDRRLHINHLFTCATQTPFFHVIGCSPVTLDPSGAGEPVTLPSTIGRWTNFFVPLDPWAYSAAPVFTLADGSSPHDVEVHAGNRDDRIGTHRARHYWNHPVVVKTMQQQLPDLA